MLKSKILIVDDETDYCLIMKSYFEEKNYDVFLAYTIKDGLALLKQHDPDILFLDNNLPDGKGWQYVDDIVENIPHLKVYLVSAYRQRSDFLSTSPNITVWEKPISLSALDTVF
jgi:DNA-binding response OmpR family regulator